MGSKEPPKPAIRRLDLEYDRVKELEDKVEVSLLLVSFCCCCLLSWGIILRWIKRKLNVLHYHFASSSLPCLLPELGRSFYVFYLLYFPFLNCS